MMKIAVIMTEQKATPESWPPDRKTSGPHSKFRDHYSFATDISLPINGRSAITAPLTGSTC